MDNSTGRKNRPNKGNKKKIMQEFGKAILANNNNATGAAVSAGGGGEENREENTKTLKEVLEDREE